MSGSDPWAQANQEFQCPHADVSLRRRTWQVNGKAVTHIYEQCMRCGKGLGARKKHPPSSINESELEPFDEQLPAEWRERWQARFEELRRPQSEEESEEWCAGYDAYMSSPAWQDRRQRILARDGRVCRGCLGQSGVPATQVHHLSYEHLGAEFAWELAAVCRVCHERLHGRSFAEPVATDRVPDAQTVQHALVALRGEGSEARKRKRKLLMKSPSSKQSLRGTST